MLTIISWLIILTAGLCALFSLLRPGFALALVLSLYALEQVLQQGNAFLLNNGMLINIVIGGTAATAVIASVVTGRFKLNGIPVAVTCVYLLHALCFLSLYWCIDYRETLEWQTRFLPYVALFVFIAPLCSMRSANLQDAASATLILGFLIMAGLAFSSYGQRGVILTTLQGKEVEGNPLAAGTFGGYVTICAIFSIYGKRRVKWLFWGKLIIVGLGIYTVFRSGSRGQLIAMIMAIMFWLPVTAKIAAKRSSIIALIAVTCVLSASAYLVGNSELLVRWDPESLQVGTVGRMDMSMTLVWAMIDAGPGHWFFGLGNSASFDVVGWYPHMVPMEILAEEGLIGFVLFCWFVFAVFRESFHTMFLPKLDSTIRVNVGMFVSLFTFELILCCKQGSLLLSPGAGVFCLGLCLAWACSSIRKEGGMGTRAIQLKSLPPHMSRARNR